MESTARSRDVALERAAVLAAGAAVTLIGLLGLLGWLTDQPSLTTWKPATVPMAPVTAILCAALGVAIGLTAPRQPRPAALLGARVLAGACALITLSLYLTRMGGWLTRFELLGLPIAGTVDGAPIGYISPITAFCFLVASVNLLVLSPSAPHAAWRIASGRAGGAVLAFTGFVLVGANLLGAPLLTGLVVIPVSLNASVVVFISGPVLWLLAGRLHPNPREPAPVRPFVWIFAAVVATITAGGYAYYRQLERELRSDIEHQLEAVAELKTVTVSQWRRERLGDANLLFRNASITNLVRRALQTPGDADVGQQIAKWFHSYETYLQYDRMTVFDADGAMLGSWPVANETPAATISAQVLAVLRSRQVAIQDFYLDESDGRVHMATLVPVLDDTGAQAPLGVLALRIDPELFLYPFIERWPAANSATAETMLVRRDGNDAVFLNGLRFAPEAALRLRVPMTNTNALSVRALWGVTGTMEGEDYRGARAIAVIRTVPDSPWLLMVRIDLAEFNAQLWQRLRVVATFGALLLLSAGSGLGLVWRTQRLTFYEERLALVSDLSVTASHLKDLLANSPTIVYALEKVDGEFVPTAVSPNIERLFGYDMEEALHRSFWLSHVHPDDRDEALRSIASLDTNDARVCEYRFLRKDGSELWVMDRLNVVRRDADGPVAVAGSWNDVTERKRQELRARRLTQLYRALTECNQAIVRSRNEADLFPRVCDAAVTHGGMAMAWVGLTDEQGMLKPVACAGAGTAYLDGIDVSVRDDSPLGRGPTGTSVRENRPVWLENFRTDPSTQLWHERAEKYGWAASVGLPLTREGRAVGALTIYAGTPDAFDDDGRELLIEMATDISFALDTFARDARRVRAEEAVRASLHEKEALLMEVHHRVKNNLQVITSLLRLEAGRSARPEVAAVLAEMQSRVLSMALLHETLYRSGNLAAVDLSVYLTQLGNQIVRSLAPASGVTLHLDVDPISIALDQAVPCGLLVNELMSNALKHAFPDGRSGEIRVEAHPVSGGPGVRLVVADNGVGLPANFDEARQRSLGLQLVSDLVRQLRGALDIQSGPGTTFSLTFVPRSSAGVQDSRTS